MDPGGPGAAEQERNGDQLHRAGRMEAAARLIEGSVFIMSDQLCDGPGGHRHARTFPALTQFPGPAVNVHGGAPARYPLAICRGFSRIGRLHRSARTPRSRQPSWFSKNMGCQGDAEPQAGRAEQRGLNDVVGFQFCELIIAASSRPPGARYNILHNLLHG